ncbi:MAG: carboxypeptidase-like regulatory domain-containing protein, partial [Acidobacteriota bacterium]
GGGGGLPPRDTAATTNVGTGTISGTVVGETTGNPVRRARVTLTGAELRGGRSVMTDDQGRFTFQALPAGRFTMTASKPGFVDNTYGAKRPGRPGTPIQLADGQAFNRATITLPRGGVITGIVVDETGEPAAGTQVRVLRYVLRTGERVLQDAGRDTADDRGMYRIFQLQPGEYIVNAEPRNMSVGDLRASISTEVAALMQQAQTLSGRAGGAPDVAGLASLAASGRGSNVMDRVAQLQEQLAQADQQPSTAYAPVYYPGTTSASGASTVTLGVGEERGGVDFQLQLVPTTRVSGMVAGPNGTPPPGTQVALVPADRSSLPGLFAFSMNQTRVGADGRFTFTNVTPGQYSLQARATVRDNTAGANQDSFVAAGPGFGRGGPNGPQAGGVTQVLWAAADVAIGGQPLPDLVLTLQPGMIVSGRVEFDNGSTPVPTDLTRVRVNLATRGSQLFEIGGTPPGQTEASGHFTIAGVAPGRYTVNAALMPQAAAGGRGGRGAGVPGQAAAGQWTLKSAVIGGRDVLDFPIDVGPNENLSNAVLTFTDKTQELSGTIQDASGRPTSDFTIVLFSSDSRYWVPQSRRIASARPGTDGRFTIRGVPAGSYRLTAVTDAEPGEWYDPAFLGQVQQASIPITLEEGTRKTQDIRLAGGQ